MWLKYIVALIVEHGSEYQGEIVKPTNNKYESIKQGESERLCS